MSETPSPAGTPLADPGPDGFDPRRRRLCTDGTCVGVVGADGRCRVCGLAHPEGAAPEGLTLADPGEREADFDAADTVEDEDIATAASEGGTFDSGRGLCPDGSCVGVLGADGRCKVCGQSAAALGG